MIKLLFAGDVFLGNTTFTKNFGYGAKSIEFSEEFFIKNLSILTKGNDINFCNLETTLSENKELVRASSFIGYSNIAKILKNSGINIVSIANNHILDYGEVGFYQTINILNKNGIKFIGKNENGISNISVFEVNKVKIGFAAFNGVDLHKIKNPDLFAELNERNIKLTLKKMQHLDLDVKILSFHWGDEYISYPSYEQIRLGHFAIDNGADIIIGHHPHVIQPIENYKNGLIIYSLGNCIFDFLQSKKFQRGIILKVILNEYNKKFQYEIYPIQLNNKNFFEIQINARGKYIKSLNKKLLKVYSRKYIYKRYYLIKLKLISFLERILMKISLIKLFLVVNNYERMLLIGNLIKYYRKNGFLKKIKNFRSFLI